MHCFAIFRTLCFDTMMREIRAEANFFRILNSNIKIHSNAFCDDFYTYTYLLFTLLTKWTLALIQRKKLVKDLVRLRHHKPQVGKSACIVLAKERHSKGERVPFSAYTPKYTKLKLEAADTLSLMFKIFLEKNYHTPCNIPIRLISASPHLKEIATLFSKIITKSCKISPIFLQITTLLSKPCKILAIFTQITPTCPKSNRNLSDAYQIY